MSVGPSEGRIKRHVVGKTHLFLAVCPPGFEDCCLAELRSLGLAVDPGVDDRRVRADGGVIAFEGKLDELYLACLGSRTVSRFRIVLDDFRTGAREELFRKASAFPWELWLRPGPLKIDAHVEYSRISHEGLAAETLREAVGRRFSDCGMPAPGVYTARTESSEEAPPQSLLLRIVENRTVVSLDASGEHQHRRAWRLFSGHAPIRENLAAAILGVAGWPGEYGLLMDGMSGSGTFAIEAELSVLGRWPGENRSFAFELWPGHQAARWNWLRKQDMKTHTAGGENTGSSANVSPPRVMANEIDGLCVEEARKNAARASADGIVWRCGDFYDITPAELDAADRKPSTGRAMLVLNPPYGKRLGEVDDYARLSEHLLSRWGGWRVVLLAPEHANIRSLEPFAVSRRTFRHGGLRISVLVCDL